MKILIVAPRFPYPLDSGDRITIFHLISHLSRNHEVDLVTFSSTPIEEDHWNLVKFQCRSLNVFQRSLALRFLSAVAAVLRRRPLQIAHTRAKGVKKKIAELIDQNDYDVIYAHTIRVADLIPDKAKTGRMLRIIGMQIAMNLNYRRLAVVEANPIYRTLFRYEANALKHYECDIVDKFDRALAISNVDVEAICANKKDKFFLSPHGVNIPDPSNYESVVKKEATIVFTGNMQYRPNVQAAVHFCKNILPIIHKSRPKTKFEIIGANPVDEVKKLGLISGVSVTGRVDDMFETLFAATIAVDPLTAGAGLQNKVLEAMACGIPMVITPMANEGIGAKHSENILIADDPEKFAHHVLDLLDDSKLRESIGSNARKFIVENWT